MPARRDKVTSVTDRAGRDEGSSKGRLVVIGLVGGLLSGFFGVGGGIILVPLLVVLGRFPQHGAHATSLAAIFIIGLSTLTGYATAGEVDGALGLALGVGGIVGAVFGASLMHRLSASTLKLTFAALLVAMGVRMLV